MAKSVLNKVYFINENSSERPVSLGDREVSYED